MALSMEQESFVCDECGQTITFNEHDQSRDLLHHPTCSLFPRPYSWAIAILIGGLRFRKFCYAHEIVLFVECLDGVYDGPIMIQPW